MEKIGHERVFHELIKKGKKFHKNVDRFFNDRYLKKIGIKDGVRKVEVDPKSRTVFLMS